MSARAVIGVPLYNNAEQLPETLESLLSQTYEHFAVVLVDDCSSDATPDIAERYGALDDRITYVRNDERLGMILNWRKAFEVARENHAEMEYFAWASDHDIWHRRWMKTLVEVLDREPDVVMTYPLNIGIDDAGNTMRDPWEFDTYGLRDPRKRLRESSRDMAAGSMVYGLYRADTLARCGVYRLVLLPDRLLISELALYGQFKQVPEILWYRRYQAHVKPSNDRQRRAFFPHGAPPYAYLPWSMLHPAAMAWALAVRGDGRPEIGRLHAVGLSAWYLTLAVRFQANRWFRHRVKQVLRFVFRRALPAATRGIGGDRAMMILSKNFDRASDVARSSDLTVSDRARRLMEIGKETAAQLQRGRALRAAAPKPPKEAKPPKPSKGAKPPKPPRQAKAPKPPKAGDVDRQRDRGRSEPGEQAPMAR